jgi:hypothetical protein
VPPLLKAAIAEAPQTMTSRTMTTQDATTQASAGQADAARLPPDMRADKRLQDQPPGAPAPARPAISGLWSAIVVLCASVMAVPLIWIVMRWVTHD